MACEARRIATVRTQIGEVWYNVPVFFDGEQVLKPCGRKIFKDDLCRRCYHENKAFEDLKREIYGL